GGELAVLDLVLDLGGQLAARDAVAYILARIARQAGQLEALHRAGDVQVTVLAEGVELADHRHRRGVVDLAGEIERGDRGRIRGHPEQRAGHTGQVDVVVRPDEAIAEGDVAAPELDPPDADRRRRRGLRR